MRVIILLSTLALYACASSPKLTDEENKVRIFRGSFSLEGCTHKAALREYLPISYSSDISNLDLAGDYLKRAAHSFGANTVVQHGTAEMGSTAYGSAYDCKY